MEVALTSKKLFNTLFFAFIFLFKKDMCTLLETFSERWKNPEGPDADNIKIRFQKLRNIFSSHSSEKGPSSLDH